MQKFLTAIIDQDNANSLSFGDELNLTESSGISSIKFESVITGALVVQIFAPELPSLAIVIFQETVQPMLPTLPLEPSFNTAVDGRVCIFFNQNIKVKVIVWITETP